jgi:hypothetical protein
MAVPRPDYERIAAEHEAEAKEAERALRRYWVLTLLVCLGWCVAGGFVTTLGFTMVLPPDTAWELIYAGQGIALGGVVLTVVVAGHHRRSRGYD